MTSKQNAHRGVLRSPFARPRAAHWLGLCALLLCVAAPAVRSADSAEMDVAAAAPGLGAFAVAPSQRAPEAPSPKRQVTEGLIARGRTLSELLRADGVSPQVISRIAREMRGHFDFRHARPGHSFRLVRDGTGEIVEFRYRLSETEGWSLVRHGDRYAVSRDLVELEARSTRIAGVITSTLYQSITNLGEDGQLARDFADIFAWDVDFQRSVHPGDSYQILYERLYRTGGNRDVYVRPGRILAARFEGRAGTLTAVYFQPDEGRGGYYRPNGSSVEGAFLMSPLRHGRITSSFSAARRHPILKVTRPHHGIDYAAPLGTPVWSVGNGTVIHRSWNRGSGNMVKVRHDNGYVSYYLHLSRFASGLSVGDRVEQKQVVGYVGQTGLATGPHVCFRMQKDGRYLNPGKLSTPAGDPIPTRLIGSFRTKRDLLLAELDGRRPVVGVAGP